MTVSVGAHGGDAGRVARQLGLDPAQVIDLSASLNPFAPDPVDIIAPHLGALGRYPDPADATEQLAAAIDVDPATLVLTNGGAEAIALVAAHLGTGSVIDPDFSLYRRHLPTIDCNAGRWRSNPASPLGTLADPDDRAAVWDEAFYPLATGTWTRGDQDSWRLGSLTKVWSCPGLRLGYVIAPSAEHADVIRSAQPQWSVNNLALAAMADFLAATDLPGWSTAIVDLRHRFTTELEDAGLHVQPSTANWVLVHDVPHLRAQLAHHGIVIRDCTSFGLPQTVRVALPRQSDFDRVVTSIRHAIAQ